jgi:L-cysteine/cystine lyase
MPDLEKVDAIRRLLPATSAGIYLNAGSVGPMPAETQAAMDEQAAHELAVGRAKTEQFLAFQDRMAECRAAVASVVIADPDDIALTHSATDGLNLVISSLWWSRGDRVLTTNHEHPGVLGPLQALRDRLGVEEVKDDVGDGGDDARTLAAFGEALERPAKAVVVSHVLWTTGATLPADRIGALARQAGAVTIIDGAQAAGAIPLTLEDLDVDAYAMPGQKWLLGPEGMGALWVRRSFADATIPSIAGYLAYASLSGELAGTLHRGARRFEATGYHRPSVVGLARSCGWLSMFVGVPWAIERSNRLAAVAADRLASIPGVSLLTPRGQRGTLVSFRIDGWSSGRAANELGSRAFAILRNIPPVDAVRISVGFWNTESELETVAQAVELLAAHTPGTLPQRRTLAVLGSDGQPLS